MRPLNPFSAVFGAGVALRNALYDRELLGIHRLTRPVVSVGNISVGGSGKTPFVIALGALLKQHGIERAAPRQYDADGTGEPA